MTNRLWKTAIERAGALTAPMSLDELSDAELLRRFVSGRDECAFAALVRRHGSLVWATCRSLMPSEADAEDAYQATFLVLVRSAAKVKRPNALGAWLHTVAGRVCRNGLRATARRRKHEHSAAVRECDQPIDSATWDRWQAIAHEEIDRLPESLRTAFVLCVMQGVRQTEAAERLGWKIGTVSGRVCKAKQAIADALARRGLTGAAALGASLGGATAPLSASLVNKATEVAVRSSEISRTIHELARGAMGGFMSKTKLLAAAVLVTTLTIGVGTNVLSTADAQPLGPQPPSGAPGASSKPKASLPGAPAPQGPGYPDMPGLPPGASGGGGGRSLSMLRVEYQFLARPKASNAFKKLLIDEGKKGWEYVGIVPGDEELIFKRSQRGSPFGGMGMPGDPGRMGGGPPGIPGPAGPRPGAAGPAGGVGPAGQNAPGAGRFGSGDRASGGAPGIGSAPRSNVIEIQTGETIRYKMSTNNEIDRVFSQKSTVAEVSPDPTNAKRVLIRGLTSGSSKLELTDASGAKEIYTVRVK